jgi:Protein of unknown function (DUF3435)
MVQQAVVKLWSSITGTRPGVMLPQNEFAGSAVTGTPRQRKRKFPIQSDLPQLVSLNDLPNTVCWRGIELFLLRNPDGDRDVVCVIVEFRNLKGRPEGADG